MSLFLCGMLVFTSESVATRTMAYCCIVECLINLWECIITPIHSITCGDSSAPEKAIITARPNPLAQAGPSRSNYFPSTPFLSSCTSATDGQTERQAKGRQTDSQTDREIVATFGCEFLHKSCVCGAEMQETQEKRGTAGRNEIGATQLNSNVQKARQCKQGEAAEEAGP
jgi:hypothetical protein